MSDLHNRVMDAMGIALLVRDQGTRFRIEYCPRWLQPLVGDTGSWSAGEVFDVVERFPVLEPFLEDLDADRDEGELVVQRSGLWVESRGDGSELPLQAYALHHEDEQVLLLAAPVSDYLEKREILTKARTSKLEHERLRSEIQKKEILLHCIIHDLAQPLTGIQGFLFLMKGKAPDDKSKRWVELGLQLCDKQKHLIRSILDAFSAELASPETATLEPGQAPDALGVMRAVRESLRPAFDLRKATLETVTDLADSAERTVRIDASSLERVLANLVDNALRHSPEGSTVTLGLSRKDGSLLFTVDDQGPGVPEELSGELFKKFSQGTEGKGKVGLGLYFCRITAERWGGAVGQENLPQGGSRFWVRLPAA
jgi:signal transduction histidine kinase